MGVRKNRSRDSVAQECGDNLFHWPCLVKAIPDEKLDGVGVYIQIPFCGDRKKTFNRSPPCFDANWGHHRICSKSYSKDSGMIPRLDVAVERRRRARPVWRAALCGQHTALEPVTERLRGSIPILAARTDLRAQGNVARQVARPHRFARLGTHRLQRRLRLAVRTAQTEGFGPAKAALRVPRRRLPYDLEQILR